MFRRRISRRSSSRWFREKGASTQCPAGYLQGLRTFCDRHGASESAVAPLAETAVTLAQLDALAARIGGPDLDAVLSWIAAGCSTRSLASAVEISTSRISEIVNAVKGFTYMD